MVSVTPPRLAPEVEGFYMWKIIVELLFLTPALGLCFGAFVFETFEQIRVARDARERREGNEG